MTSIQLFIQIMFALTLVVNLGITVKPVLSDTLKDQKWVFNTNYRLMQVKSIAECLHVKSIAECSKGSILQYFRPALSYHMALRPLLRLFLSGR